MPYRRHFHIVVKRYVDLTEIGISLAVRVSSDFNDFSVISVDIRIYPSGLPVFPSVVVHIWFYKKKKIINCDLLLLNEFLRKVASLIEYLNCILGGSTASENVRFRYSQ